MLHLAKLHSSSTRMTDMVNSPPRRRLDQTQSMAVRRLYREQSPLQSQFNAFKLALPNLREADWLTIVLKSRIDSMRRMKRSYWDYPSADRRRKRVCSTC